VGERFGLWIALWCDERGTQPCLRRAGAVATAETTEICRRCAPDGTTETLRQAQGDNRGERRDDRHALHRSAATTEGTPTERRGYKGAATTEPRKGFGVNVAIQAESAFLTDVVVSD
jgi:hypothetical protein